MNYPLTHSRVLSSYCLYVWHSLSCLVFLFPFPSLSLPHNISLFNFSSFCLLSILLLSPLLSSPLLFFSLVPFPSLSSYLVGIVKYSGISTFTVLGIFELTTIMGSKVCAAIVSVMFLLQKYTKYSYTTRTSSLYSFSLGNMLSFFKILWRSFGFKIYFYICVAVKMYAKMCAGGNRSKQVHYILWS